jgi:hypothetical protein
MAPILRSFSKPIVQAFKDAGIEDQLKDFDHRSSPSHTHHHQPAEAGMVSSISFSFLFL